MREILYRARSEENGEWVYGYYVNTGRAPRIYQCDKFNIDGKEFHLVYSCTVGQYIGVDDKFNREIFEGDIISAYLDDLEPNKETRLKIVCRGTEFCGYNIKTGLCHKLERYYVDYFKIIGNEYDNPYLLEGGKKDNGISKKKKE